MVALVFSWAAFALGALICLANFFLAFVRCPMGRFLGYPREAMRPVSVIPLFGSALVGLSLIGLYANPISRWLAIGLILMDIGGIHWFAFLLVGMTGYALIYWLIYGKHPGNDQ